MYVDRDVTQGTGFPIGTFESQRASGCYELIADPRLDSWDELLAVRLLDRWPLAIRGP